MLFDAALALTLTFVGNPATSADPLALDAELRGVETRGWGLEVGVELMSIYNDRGTNAFSTTDQLEQGLSVAPTVGYAFGESGWFVEYTVVVQLAGTDPDAMTRDAVNAEHGLVVGVERGLWGERLTAGAQLVTVMYPFADSALVRDFVPTVLEPTLLLDLHDFVDVGIELTYSFGAQPELADARFVYVRPHVARSFAPSSGVALGASFGAGYKFFEQPDANPDRRVDLEANLDVTFEVGGWSVAPALNAAWTELAGEDFGAGMMVWGSVAVSTVL